MDLEQSVDKLISGFHKSVDVLNSVLFDDPAFSVRLYGQGFSDIGASVGELNQGVESVCTFQKEEENSRYFGFTSNYEVTAYHVLKNALAFCNENKGKVHPKQLVFNASPTEIQDVLELTISSRTFSHFEKVYPNNHFGKQLQNAVKIIQNEHETTRFIFRSNIASQKMDEYSGGKLAIVRPKTLFSIENSGCGGLQVKSGHLQCVSANMQAVNCVLAIHCTNLPCEEWFTRTSSASAKNSWPSVDTIEKVKSHGVYLIPYKAKDDWRNHEKDYLWQYSFVDAEKILLDSMDENTRFLYKAISGIVNNVHRQTFVNVNTLRQCFLHNIFWFLEKGFPESHNRAYGLELLLKNFLEMLLKDIEGNFIPHYFISNINLLENLSDEGVILIYDSITNFVTSRKLMENVTKFTSISPISGTLNNNYDNDHLKNIERRIIEKVTENLVGAFSDCIRISHQHLFSKLNRGESIEDCIESHHFFLKNTRVCLQNGRSSHSFYEKLKDWAIRIASSNLGSLYLAKAQISQVSTSSKGNILTKKKQRAVPTYQTFYLIGKAEEMFLISNNVDLLSGRVKLANFYYMNHQFRECFGVADEILHLTGTNITDSSDYDSLPTKAIDFKSDEQCLNIFLGSIVKRNVILDLLYSDLDRTTLPLFMSKYLSYTRSQLHGDKNTNVYVLDAHVYTRILYAMSQYQLGEKNNAIIELVKLENLWNKTEADLNEKRNIAYLNTIALCYLEMGEKKDGIRILEASSNEYGNLGTSLMLLDLKTEKTREVAQTTVSVAVGVVLAATVIGIVKSKFM